MPARIRYRFPLEEFSVHCKLLVSLYSNNHVTGNPLSILALDSKQHKKRVFFCYCVERRQLMAALSISSVLNLYILITQPLV
jgi:hypothetical protein